MFIQVFLVGILAGMSPGPDFFVVMKNSLGFGRRSGIASALGIGTALAIHATYTILGIALILQHYVLLFKLIQLMGATYLVYLAIQTILSTFSKKNNQLGEDIAFEGNKSFQEGFKNGLLCNLLNPKAFLFFLSIFSQFISADTHSWIRW
ncbi:MAG: LysE family translocator, partial [Clostridia bacterium]|nr:LysE family translocator [Clostridia bacterium]